MPEPDRLVGIRFLYPASDLTFDDLEVPAGLVDEPWVHEVRRVSEPGTELRLPPRQFLGRAGFVIATGTPSPTWTNDCWRWRTRCRVRWHPAGRPEPMTTHDDSFDRGRQMAKAVIFGEYKLAGSFRGCEHAASRT